MDLDILTSLNYIVKFILSATIQNKTCRNHTYEMWNGIWQAKPWAIRMIDSAPKMPSGLLDVNLMNLGNMHECLDVRVDENFGKFTGKYCLLKLLLPIQLEGENTDVAYQFGTCVPSSCSEGDMQSFLSHVMPLTNVTILTSCQTLEEQPYDWKEFLTIGFISVLALLIILSTIYDYAASSGDRNKYILSFSLKTNIRTLLDTKTSNGTMKTLHGIRVGATFLVVLAHVYYNQLAAHSSINMVSALDWISDWKHLWLTSRALPLDMFFVFGGLLASISFAKEQSEGKKFNLARYIIHRYLRLTPAMAVMLLVNATIFRRFGSGPLWRSYSQIYEEECRDHWWQFMLYINNWFVIEKCMLHTWYIAVDMQLYLLSPLLIIPLQRWPRFGLGLTFATLIAAFFTSFGIAYINEEPVEIYRNHSPEVELLIRATYHRITPWLIGFIVGYLLQKYQSKISAANQLELRIRKMTRHKILMTVFVSVFCVVMFISPYLWLHHFLQSDYQYDALESAAYLSTSHVVFALSMVFIVAACASGYGGLFDMLFSWDIFVPLSRLSYSIYLIHVTVVDMHIFSLRTQDYLSDYNVMMTSVSIIFLSVIFSTLLYLMVEKPAAILERLLLQRESQVTSDLPAYQSRDANFACTMKEITPRKTM